MGKPQVSPEVAIALAQRHWGWSAESCTQLAGYDDQNFRLSGPQGDCVFKVHNAEDSVPENHFAESQSALINLLSVEGFPVPTSLPLSHPGSSDGYTLRITACDGQVHAVRLQAWVPGTLLIDVPQSAALYRQLGALLARINRTLQGCGLAEQFPALRRKFDWNMECLQDTYARVRPGLLTLLKGSDVQLLDQTVSHFGQATGAAHASLRRCIIHSDANEKNVLVDEAAAATAAAAERQHAANSSCGSKPVEAGEEELALITGLIDWGDACEQWLAAEPANACLYLMLLDGNIEDPLPAAAALLAGYEREVPLLPAERRLLRTLITGRLAMSLSLGAYSAAQQPDNAEYLLSTQKNGWRLLRLLAGMSDADFLGSVGFDCA